MPLTKQEQVAQTIQKMPLNQWISLRQLAMQIPIKNSYMPPRDLAGHLLRYKKQGIMINKTTRKYKGPGPANGLWITMWKKTREITQEP